MSDVGEVLSVFRSADVAKGSGEDSGLYHFLLGGAVVQERVEEDGVGLSQHVVVCSELGRERHTLRGESGLDTGYIFLLLTHAEGFDCLASSWFVCYSCYWQIPNSFFKKS